MTTMNPSSSIGSAALAYTDIREHAVNVGPADAFRIEQAAAHLATLHSHRSLHSPILLRDIEVAALSALPTHVTEKLIEFRDHSNSWGTLLLRGMPTGIVPVTPEADDSEDWRSVPTSSLVQLMVMSVMGRSVSYSDEKSGHLIQNVVPRRGSETRQENSGCVLLELHTEDGFHPNPPHFLSLHCLRGDHDNLAATVTSGVGDVLPHLDAAAVAELRRCNFRTKFSTSFVDDPTREQWTLPHAILTGNGEVPDLVVDFNATEPMTPAASEAYFHLRKVMIDNLVGVALQPQEMILVDNRRAVHGRTSFIPRYDGTDRWLRRSFSISDLRPLHGYLQPGQRSHQPVT
ncbi:L-asparagine oxygenase [Rhodococcus fascians]|uniref:TauD/TfdA family dioxygenase n=1 Tax=Nocardiaceae TaxID=85025 RepID=UPI0028670BAF|nr:MULTISPECIES: TauD/TfdA family dioxygenase [Rhodococcus]MDR6912942.1 L-asparagine oxygenase [Rhodococcus sp. 3258]MDR6934539.1 L-asparagine oxygenase [Rhodococcus fascians]